jgi:hypothetical protein
MHFIKAEPGEARDIRCGGYREFIVEVESGARVPRQSDPVVFFCHSENFIAAAVVLKAAIIWREPVVCLFTFEITRPLEETCE